MVLLQVSSHLAQRACIGRLRSAAQDAPEQRSYSGLPYGHALRPPYTTSRCHARRWPNTCAVAVPAHSWGSAAWRVIPWNGPPRRRLLRSWRPWKRSFAGRASPRCAARACWTTGREQAFRCPCSCMVQQARRRMDRGLVGCSAPLLASASWDGCPPALFKDVSVLGLMCSSRWTSAAARCAQPHSPGRLRRQIQLRHQRWRDRPAATMLVGRCWQLRMLRGHRPSRPRPLQLACSRKACGFRLTC